VAVILICRVCSKRSEIAFGHGEFCSKKCEEAFLEKLAAGEAKLERRLRDEIAAEFVKRGAEPARSMRVIAMATCGLTVAGLSARDFYAIDDKSVAAFVDRLVKLVTDADLRQIGRAAGQGGGDHDLPDWPDVGELSVFERDMRSYQNIVMCIFAEHARAFAGYYESVEFRVECEVKTIAAAFTLDEMRKALDAALWAGEFSTTSTAAQIYAKRAREADASQQREVGEGRKAMHKRFFSY